MRTWQDNAQEFGLLGKQGKDIRLALLAACSVVRDARHGRPQKKNSPIGEFSKVSVKAFAEAAGTGQGRVSRHLDAWDKLVQRKLVKSAAQLKPEDALTYQVGEQAILVFSEVFDATASGGRPSAQQMASGFGSRPRIRQQVIQSLTPEEKAELVKDTIRSDPKVVERVVSDSPSAAKVVRDAAQEEEVRRAIERQRAAKKAAEVRHARPLSQHFWTLIGKVGQWARDIAFIEEDLAELPEGQKPGVRESFEQLRDAVTRALAALDGAPEDDSDVIEGTGEAVDQRLLTK